MNEHHNQQDQQSGVNTVLIVLLIIIVLGGAIWFLGGFNGIRGEQQDNNGDVNVELNVPENNGNTDTSNE